MISVPEHLPRQLFPETETQFFLKGNPTRWIFHRDETGHVDYAISRCKTVEEKAQKQIKQMGLNIEVISSKPASISRGYWAGVQIDTVTRHIKGGVSRGLGGGVAGY